MLAKTIFAGFGGQGVLLMGFCLATTGMNEDKHVTYLPSYGAEVRGGTANCTVSVSTEEIASPISSSPDFVVVMNNPSLLKFQNLVKSGGVFLVNSSLVDLQLARDDVTEIRVPGSKLAEDLGSMRSANMVMLGAFAAATDIVSYHVLLETVREITGKKRKELMDANVKAIETGYNYVKNIDDKTAGKDKKKS
ncbi:MAG TPA: 2-oxoacid:acceptor oxidoreductase family protein [bacterium]|nr:2-oxoacid:acceptor oxidoreductase family protein [bacterium]